MHLDDEQVQRLLHGELASPATTLVREHIAACGDCRTRVAAAAAEERQVFALLGHLDHPMPDVQARSIIETTGDRRRVAFRWAAAILMAVGLAGAAYAAPGSPVRDWVEGLVRGAAEPRAPTPLPDEPRVTRAFGGLAVAPGKELTIAFETTAAGGEVRVSLIDGSDVVIRAPAGAAEYTARETRILVTPRVDATTYEVEIPHTAARVEILLGAVRMYLKHGPSVSGLSRFPLR